MPTASLKDDYVLGRDLYGSIRLDAQHLLWNLYNGYTLNPKIPTSPTMKVAEVGTGTGLWILDAASQLPSTVQFDGYDISDNQFPHRSVWPENVLFKTLDAFGDVPDSIAHKYDVVHLRFWCCVVKFDDPSSLIRHVIKLLKPGGYIQWEDAHIGKTTVLGKEAQAFSKLMRTIFETANIQFNWIGTLEHHARNHGLLVLDGGEDIFSPSFIPLCTNTYLSGHVELFQAVDKLGHGRVPSQSECQRALNALVIAVRNGAKYHWPPVTLLAQVPLNGPVQS